MTTRSEYARHEHHEFLIASAQALEDKSLQSSLSLLGSSLGHRNQEAFAAFTDSPGDSRTRPARSRTRRSPSWISTLKRSKRA